MGRALAFAAAAALLAVPAAAAAPVDGSIFGAVVSAGGGTFTMTSTQVPGGKSVVAVGKATISERTTAAEADLRKGLCATATGTTKNGVVTARRISLAKPVRGSCTGGFRRPNGSGQRPTGTRPPTRTRPSGGFRRPANFGFAVGAITAVSGSTLTLHGPRGTQKVTVAKTTQITKTVDVAGSAITTKSCAFVQGTSTDKGKTVKATQIALTPRTSSGCTFGFGRRPPAGG
jgi:hypothetical protein